MEEVLERDVTGSSRRVPGAGLATFMELRGRRVVDGLGALWHGVEGGFYMSVPYQLRLDPDAQEADDFLRSHRAVGIRFPSLCTPGVASGLYVCRRKPYAIESVHRKQRYRVRRGLERCRIRQVEESELLTQGLRLNLDTMHRQGRYDSEFGDPRRWRCLVGAVRRCPPVVPVGAFVGGRLAAYMITCREDGWLHILHQMSSAEHLDDFPNHALTFQVTKEAAEDPSLDAVCYGVLGLVKTEGLHEYKLRFGYELVPHNSVCRFHPLLAPLFAAGPICELVRGMRRVLPGYQRLERLETVMHAARLSRSQAGSMRATEAGSTNWKPQ